ncbi:MAG TPA: ATP-binding protein [Candidatus Binatia bacterium]|nr:ATP-binding protein [Candidatus Binatia bacterium]
MTLAQPEPQAPVDLAPPPPPESVEDTGLDLGFLADLALKTVAADANCTTDRVADRIKLPPPLAEILLQHLYQEKLVEIRGLVAFRNHRYAMIERGWQRVQRLLETSGYVGPAPVSLGAYTEMIQRQERHRPRVRPEAIQAAMGHLVLAPGTLQTLGLVASSRRSLFITGPAGNGKTSIARALHDAQAGDLEIPYAIEVDGQVIKIFDIHNHQPVDLAPGQAHDQRWVRIRRPLVIVGGELAIETMDLIYSRTVRFYEAPFQMKSNGGTLVIDDFGRQRVDPHDLLNRWIIPLEGHIDYLTLHTGKKIEVPFEQLLVFATNLAPESIVDDAFLRRMGYRLRVERPDRDAYASIFCRHVEALGLRWDRQLLDTLFALYERDGRPMAGCEPRDLVDRCADIARFEHRPLALTPELIEVAWVNYFGSAARGRQ